MKKILLMILPATLLGGCGNLSLDGLTSTAGATAGAALGGIVNPGTAVLGGIVGGVTVDAVTPPPVTNPQDFAGPDGTLSFTELLAFMWYNFTTHLITIGIIIGLFWILSTWLGMRKKRPEEKVAEKQISMLIDKIGKMKEGD